jgi:malate dehydrogenase (oxaloacetate-decarboxylating)
LIHRADAYEAGALIVATGRSDFPNQVNNSLVFPGLFRALIDTRAKYVIFKLFILTIEYKIILNT